MKKRVVSMILVVMMCMVVIRPVNAEEIYLNYEYEAEVMHELGVFEGTSKNSFVPDLASSTNREQSIKMIASVLQWDVDLSKKSGFNDVSAWAEPYVAKAVELGITNGIGNGMFGGQKSVTGKEVCTWLLRALGVPNNNAWDNTNYYIDIYYQISLRNSLDDIYNRDLLIGTLYSFLNKKPMNSDQLLIEGIVKEDPELMKIAENAMLIDDSFQNVLELNGKTIDLKQEQAFFSENTDAISYMKDNFFDIDLSKLQSRYDFIPAALPVEGEPQATETNYDCIEYVLSDKSYVQSASISFDVRNNRKIVHYISINNNALFSYDGYKVGDEWTNEDTDKYFKDDSYYAKPIEKTLYAGVAGAQYYATTIQIEKIDDRLNVVFYLTEYNGKKYIDWIFISAEDK